MISRQRLIPLLKRAAMTIYEFNTSVLRASNKVDKRIMVAGALDSLWGDCVGLYCFDSPGWREIVVLSPARARILAEHLIRKAEYIEKINGKIRIDNQEKDAA